MLASVAVTRVAEVDWAVLSDRERFSYDYAQGMIMLWSKESSMVDQNAGEGEGERGSQSFVRPVYCAGYSTREMLL